MRWVLAALVDFAYTIVFQNVQSTGTPVVGIIPKSFLLSLIILTIILCLGFRASHIGLPRLLPIVLTSGTADFVHN
jgi:hypothetical protein